LTVFVLRWGSFVTQRKLAVLTPSFEGDFDQCRLLVQSLEKHLKDDYKHYVVVDRSDEALFKQIESSRTEIVLKEDVLPFWISPWKVPLPRSGRVMRPSLKSWPIRGWIYQQMAKVEMAHRLQEEVVIMSDSDVILIKDLSVYDLIGDGHTPLYWKPGQNDLSRTDHVKWHYTSCKVMGYPEPQFPQPNYISPFNLWRPEQVRAMKKKMEDTTGTDWITTIARNWDFCEPIAYGTYVEAEGPESCGHRFTEENLCHSHWDLVPLDAAGLEKFLSEMPEHCYSVNIQSKSGTPQSVFEHLAA